MMLVIWRFFFHFVHLAPSAWEALFAQGVRWKIAFAPLADTRERSRTSETAKAFYNLKNAASRRTGPERCFDTFKIW